MSFDIFLQRFESGEPAAAHKQPVLDLLQALNHKPPDHGVYELLLPDGASLDFAAGALASLEPFQGCAFLTHGLTDAGVETIFRIAKAAGMVILPADEPNSAIFVDPAIRASVPPELLQDFVPVEANSPAELRAALRIA